MANHPQAKKRNRQRLKITTRNRHFRTGFRTHMKRVLMAIEASKKNEAQEALKTAIRNLDRAIHIRNYNRDRKIDSTGEWYYEYPEKSDGSKLNMKIFDAVLDSYYDKRGWDKATGRPTRKKLEELGLKDVADELEKSGKLPT